MAQAFEQELQRERRLAGAGRPFHEVKPVRRNSSRQDIVKSFDARRGARQIRRFGLDALHVSTFGMARSRYLPPQLAHAARPDRSVNNP